MRIVIPCHFVLDEIHAADGSVTWSYGGAFFPVSVFSALSRDNVEIIPVFPVGEDIYDELVARLERLPGVRTDGVYRVTMPTTRVKLFFDSATHYNTCLVRHLPPIPYERIGDFLPADLVYLNAMTAADITLETAERLRGNGARVYHDVHMLAYAVVDNGRRVLRPQPEWQRWCAAADVIQMNEQEASVFTGKNKSLREVAADVLGAGAGIAVFTRGARGALIADGKGLREVPVEPVGTVRDTTGCGDAFGAGFILSLLRGRSIEEAARNATSVAARVATLSGSEGIEMLRRSFDEALP